MLNLSDHNISLCKEIINGIGDCLGLWGAILLARPFVESQNFRNIILRLQRRPDLSEAHSTAGARADSAQDFDDAVAISIANLQKAIDISAPREYLRGIRGAQLLTAAFGIKLLPFAYAIYEVVESAV
jgi:hypothetical protein